jgi:glycosyltransferase involved in cell wall biosynthesis
VLPSLEESFGNTMAESMALGVPVLSTTAGSIPEVVKHGEHGLLVPPDDAQALAAAMGALGADPALRARLGAAGKVYASAHFTWDASAAAFERVYAQALANNREL